MVKLREEFHREDDHTIEPAIWFKHVADNRSDQDLKFLQHAYHFISLPGENIPTFSGLSAIQFGLAMADITDNLGLDIETVVAALVYPVVQNADLTLDDVEEHLGHAIAKLVAGAKKMDAIRDLYNDAKHHHGHNCTQIDNIRKMLLAMVEDVRVVLIKLAERTILMRAVRHMGTTKQQQIARETKDIYAPLANRLGIAQIKWELEDFAFRYLNADTYKSIAKSVAQKREDRERFVQDIITTLQQAMASAGIKNFEVTGRAKHIYSIYKKMQRKQVDFGQIYDAIAVRVLVPELDDCYAVLGFVHDLWEPIQEEYDDYIANPKPNGYRSLHTAVVGPEKRNIEVQIRTHSMHEEAELGVAAHWIYKEGSTSKRSSYDEKISWLRQLMDWQKEVTVNDDGLDKESSQIFEDRIYVFTPTGEIKDLQTGSTPLDFAYSIHTQVGHRCRGAKINAKIVPITYQLKTGDQIEILTTKEANPSRDWLNPNLHYLKSARARAKVLAWFKKQDHDQNAQLGKDMLDKELKRLHINHYSQDKLIQHYKYKTMDELYAALGAGGIKLGGIITIIDHQFKQDKKQDQELQVPISGQRKSKTHPEAIDIQGVGNLLYHFASCCKPLPGDDVLGYITQGRGVSIHRKDCNNILSATDLQKEHIIEVSWGKSKGTYPVDIVVHAYDRHGLVRDITAILSNEKINLMGLNTITNKKEHTATVELTLEIPDLSELSRILGRINQLSNVIDVKRI